MNPKFSAYAHPEALVDVEEHVLVAFDDPDRGILQVVLQPVAVAAAVAVRLWFGGIGESQNSKGPSARKHSNAQSDAPMLVELTIIPMGGDSHTSDELAEVLKLIDESGLRYQLTPSATCIEGNWEEVMAVIRLCHERVRARCPHVVTNIKIEDEDGATDKLAANVASVEAKVGRPLRRDESMRATAR